MIRCDPKKPVWVHLDKLNPINGAPRFAFPEGIDLQSRVPGELHYWQMTTTGHWAGYVSYRISQEGDGGLRMSHLVIETALEPREDAPARRGDPVWEAASLRR
ncbi:hypothetical protein V1227_19115 [Lentzea sp. DG1S-22]|uniref:hypothetical protein n=1 Tax=Lentzea sp. DG1S-22 TaxID=3108822 RepID=UPI002E79091D|nr:hypothetical protein [Lentzea sp. DG1S-22]WVH84758.1 hypothetical protein V1227_19115 [Lentzea sp. DG1S-22]